MVKKIRVFQVYRIVNQYLFCATWQVYSGDIDLNQLLTNVNNSFAMQVVNSLTKINEEQKQNNAIEIRNLLRNINIEYLQNGISEEILKMLSSFTDIIILNNKQDPFWSNEAKNILQMLIILNLIDKNKIELEDLITQCTDISKVRGLCKKNKDKINIAILKENDNLVRSLKTISNENNDKTLTSFTEIINNAIQPYIENDNNENIELKEYSQDMDKYPTFAFYFPNNIGVQTKVQNNIFEIKKDNKQVIRVMVSKCDNEEKLEKLAKEWIEKTRITNKQELKSYEKEKINSKTVLKYVLGAEKQLNKIYKIFYIDNCWVTISGTLKDNKEEIIDDAIKNIKILKEIHNEKNNTEKNEKKPIIIKCPSCNKEFQLNWNVPKEEKTFYCKCPNCNVEIKHENPNYNG